MTAYDQERYLTEIGKLKIELKKASGEERIAELTAQLASAKQEARDREARAQELDKALAAATATVQKREAAAARLQAKIEAQEARIAADQAKMRALKKVKPVVRDDKELTAVKGALRQALKGQAQLRREMELQRQRAEKTAEDLKRAAQGDAAQSAQEITAANVRAQRAKDDWKRVIKEHEAHNKESAMHIETATQKLRAATHELGLSQAIVADLKKELGKSRAEARQLADAGAALQSDKDVQARQIVAARAELKKVQEIIAAQGSTEARLRQELKESEKHAIAEAALQRDLEVQRNQAAALRADLKKARDTITAQSATAETLRQAAKDAEKKTATETARTAAAIAESDRYQTLAAVEARRVVDLEKQLGGAMVKEQELRVELSRLREHIDRLRTARYNRDDVQRLKRQVAESRATIERIVAEKNGGGSQWLLAKT